MPLHRSRQVDFTRSLASARASMTGLGKTNAMTEYGSRVAAMRKAKYGTFFTGKPKISGRPNISLGKNIGPMVRSSIRRMGIGLGR